MVDICRCKFQRRRCPGAVQKVTSRGATLFALATVGLIVVAQSTGATHITEEFDGWSIKHIMAPPTEITSVISLIAAPEKYDRKPVRVRGVLSVDFEDERLYLNQEFYEALASEYAIDLEIPRDALMASKKMHGQYVLLDGIFVRERGGDRITVVGIRRVLMKMR